MSKNPKISVKNEYSQGKLAELLRGITRDEYKKFGLFVRSPYFNKSKTMIILCDHFKAGGGKTLRTEFTNESIAKKLYPGEEFSEPNIRKQLSNFSKLLEEFLVLLESENDEARGKNILLSLAKKRNLNKSFNQTVRELENIYSSEDDKDTEYYLNFLNTQRLIFDREASTLKAPEEKISGLSRSLDLYYLSLKLLYYYDILNLRLHYNKNVEFDMWGFEEIVRFIERNADEVMNEHCPIYADFLSVSMLLHPADAEYYLKLKNYVTLKKNDLGTGALHRLYIYMYNHSVYRLNRGFVQGNDELFDIIKLLDEENVPIWNYFAFHIYYINAVTNAARAGDYKWAEEFTRKKKNMIQSDIRNETHNLAMANLNFTKGDYDTALNYLVNVDYPNYSYYLMAKDMQIKIYWERSEAEGVISTIDAMRKFLQRKDLIPERLWNCYTNFINCAAKMVDPFEKNKLFEIKKLLEKEMIAADKSWIEQQMKIINEPGS